MEDIRKETNELLRQYVGPGPGKVKSYIAAHLLGYSRVSFDRFLHPTKPFWVPAKRCRDFINFYDIINQLEKAVREFIISWKIEPMSDMERLVINAVYDRSIRKILNSKKLTYEAKVWAVINEILLMRCELGG